MATITLLGSQVASGIQPRELCTGVQSVYSVYSLSRTLSLSDTIYMCKLPDGARVLDVALTTNVNLFAAAGVLNVGIPSDATKFISSCTPSAGVVFRCGNYSGAASGGTGIGTVLDVSDTDTQRFTYIQVNCSTATTGTKSGAISLIVLYSMDQSS